MNQEQEKFQKSLRELLASAKEHGQQITAEQAERFAQEQDLTEEQRAMVFDYLALEQVEVTGAEKKQRKTERVETPLSAEEEQFLKRYLEELPVPGELGEAEKTELFRQAAGFFGGRVLTLVIEEAILLIFINGLGLPSVGVKVGAQVVVLVSNYIISKWFVFREKK